MNEDRETDSTTPDARDGCASEGGGGGGDIAQDGNGRDRPGNLTITRNYRNKTRRVEISKILDQPGSPARQPSTLEEHSACNEDGDAGGEVDLLEKDEEGTRTGAEFELTIKSNNSIIKIQGFDNKSTISFDADKCSGENVYDFLSREVDKIFDRPDKEEIEKAMRGLRGSDKASRYERSKPILKPRKNTWKALTKSLINMKGGKKAKDIRRGSVERYPKMVLLKDPEPAEAVEEDAYPKMVMIDGERAEIGNEKLASITECERIRKRKAELSEEKKLLSDEKNVLKDKIQAIDCARSELSGDAEAEQRLLRKEMNIIAEEKLCVQLEKQLLGEKKVMLKEEIDLLRKEKDMLEKERNLLGEEMSVLREERALLGVKKCDSNELERDRAGARAAAPKLAGRPRRETSDRAKDDRRPAGTPDRIPIRDDPATCVRHCEFCCCCCRRPERTARREHRATQTNSEVVEPGREAAEEVKDLDLPFGILSSFFPRIVVVKSFQEEVSSDEADAKVFEISKGDGSARDSEKEDETGCEEPDHAVDVELSCKEGSPENGKQGFADNSDPMPLTNIGRNIYEKLSEIAEERKKAAEQDEEEESGTESQKISDDGKLPCSVRFEYDCENDDDDGGGGNKLARITFREHVADSEESEEAAVMLQREDVADERSLVKKSELWYNDDSGKRGGVSNGDAAAKDFGRKFSLSVSHDNKLFTVVVEATRPSRRCTSEAKVGTDGIDLLGGDQFWNEGADPNDLSPRFGRALRTLKDKLEKVDASISRSEHLVPGSVVPTRSLHSRGSFPRDEFILAEDRGKARRQTPEARAPGKALEYYCEECAATMRLLEDERPSVRNIVDKFETIIHLGSY